MNGFPPPPSWNKTTYILGGSAATALNGHLHVLQCKTVPWDAEQAAAACLEVTWSFTEMGEGEAQGCPWEREPKTGAPVLLEKEWRPFRGSYKCVAMRGPRPEVQGCPLGISGTRCPILLLLSRSHLKVCRLLWGQRGVATQLPPSPIMA